MVVLLVVALLVIPKAVDDGSRPPPRTFPTPAPPAEVAPPPVATPSAAPREAQTKWTSDWANVREGRGLNTPIVQIIGPGQQVEVDSLQGRWWVVLVDGTPIGYVHSSLLQDEEPVPEPEPIGRSGSAWSFKRLAQSLDAFEKERGAGVEVGLR